MHVIDRLSHKSFYNNIVLLLLHLHDAVNYPTATASPVVFLPGQPAFHIRTREVVCLARSKVHDKRMCVLSFCDWMFRPCFEPFKSGLTELFNLGEVSGGVIVVPQRRVATLRSRGSLR